MLVRPQADAKAFPPTCSGQKDGRTMISPDGGFPFEVECNSGWTMIQKRTSNTDFYRQWNDYATGFGDEDNQWLGNDNAHRITKNGGQLLVRLHDSISVVGQAAYSTFAVGSAAAKYQLSVGGYSGNAGDSLSGHNGYKFSTHDQDNDVHGGSCAQSYSGAWWYSACHASNLNGKFLNGAHSSYADGMNWAAWKGYHHSMSQTKVMLM